MCLNRIPETPTCSKQAGILKTQRGAYLFMRSMCSQALGFMLIKCSECSAECFRVYLNPK